MTEHEVKETREWLQDFIRMFSCNFDDLETRGFNECVMFLKELEQYRAIEYDLKKRYHANVDIKLLIHHFIETVFEGEKHEWFCLLTNEDADMWNAYKANGTVEEFKALKEKNVAKKPRIIHSEVYNSIIHYYCPNCGRRLGERGEHNVILFKKELYCQGEDCGQKLDWSE